MVKLDIAGLQRAYEGASWRGARLPEHLARFP